MDEQTSAAAMEAWRILEEAYKIDEKTFYNRLRGNYARAKREQKRVLFLEKAYAMLFHFFPDKLAGLEGDELAKKIVIEQRVSRVCSSMLRNISDVA